MMQRLLPLIIVLIAIGISFAYTYPTYTGAITDAQQQIASYDSALAAAAAFNAKENTLLSQEAAISPNDLAKLQTYLPDNVDNVQLIVDLDALAARSGVTLSGFSIQNNATSADGNGTNASTSTTPDVGTIGTTLPQSTSLINSLNLSVSATGTYQAFQTFLTSAEQSSRPLDVTNLSVKDSNTGVYTYTITFRIYWLN